MRFIHGNTYYSHAHPSEELVRNFQFMKQLGMNAVRVAEIWPGWSVIEHIPGTYDYDLLDDYVEKAIKNKMNLCMGIGINDTPFWLYTKYPDLRFKEYNQTRSTRRVQSACVDHMEYRGHMEKFIENIVQHYKGVKEIFSWQFGNEVRYGVQYCDCDATRVRFREWLKIRYDHDLEALNREWGVYYQGWNELYPYKSYEGPPTEGIAPHCLRTLEFQNWSMEELISWGVKIAKKHTMRPVFHNAMGYSGNEGSQWKLTAPCDVAVIDIYATTYDEPGIYNGFLLETMRSIATQQNKQLWIGETSAGQYGTYARNYVDQRLIENCTMEQIGAGAQAVFYFRHKAPIWEQPHKFTGSQTFLRIDESEMAYAKTPKHIAEFMEKYEDRVLSSEPVATEVAIYYPSESINFGKEVGYGKDALDSAFGARAIWSGSQIPVQILDTDAIISMNLSAFKVIHIPVSYLMPSSVGIAIERFVRAGGTLICEGRPGYVDENGLLYKVQPGAGLHEVFGAREDLYYNIKNYPVRVLLDGFTEEVEMPSIKQTYRLFGGAPFIVTQEGEVCGVHNSYHEGNAYIIGGAPSLHYRIGGGKYESGKTNDASSVDKQRELFCKIFAHIGKKSGVIPPIRFEGGIPDLTVRYLSREKEMLMFLINYSKDASAKIVFDKCYKEISELSEVDEKIIENRSVLIEKLSWKVVSSKK